MLSLVLALTLSQADVVDVRLYGKPNLVEKKALCTGAPLNWNGVTKKFECNSSTTCCPYACPAGQCVNRVYEDGNVVCEPCGGGGGSGEFIVQQDGETIGTAKILNCGERLTCTIDGDTVTITLN
jgi:hypothetical protein